MILKLPSSSKELLLLLLLLLLLYLRPACQSFVFSYTVAVLCGSLLFTCCVCQHCNKGLLLLLLLL